MSLFWVSKMAAIFHSPFDPEIIKSALNFLLWLGVLCAFVIVPIGFYLWGVWIERQRRRASGDGEEIIHPNDGGIQQRYAPGRT